MSALVVCALASFGAAAWRDRTTRVRLAHSEVVMLPRIVTLGISVLLIVISALAATALLRQ